MQFPAIVAVQYSKCMLSRIILNKLQQYIEDGQRFDYIYTYMLC